jgi:hypothetical protein
MRTLTWAEASARLGRNDMPYALVVNWWEMPLEEQRKGLHQAWTMAEWPVLHAPQDFWVSLFQQALDEYTYLHDDEVQPTAELPSRMTLWRAATEDRALGMSWTEDKSRAQWFGRRLGEQPVWEIEVLPEYGECLAHFTGRNEAEWVLNLEGWETSQLKRVS